MQSSLNQCSKYELDLARTTPIQTSIENSIWDNIETGSNIESNSVISFTINGSNDKYIDLSQIRLFVRLNIKKGESIIGNKSISTVNNLLHSNFNCYMHLYKNESCCVSMTALINQLISKKI